jgi:hypothetical protein
MKSSKLVSNLGACWKLQGLWLAARVLLESGPAWADASASPCGEMRQSTTGKPYSEKVASMLYTIALVLLILWALGLVSSYTLGGFIHILLVVAIIMVLVNLIGGRRSL